MTELQSTLNDCIDITIQLSGGKELIFETPINVKVTPHTNLFSIYGVNVHYGDVYLMDGGGEWHGPLEVNQENAEYVINSLSQRLKWMRHELSVKQD